MSSVMSKREAIEKMGCIDKKCEHFAPKGAYTFCKVIFTDEMCVRKDKKDK